MILKYLAGGKMKQAIAGDAGFDIYSLEDCEISPMEQKWISTGLFVEIPQGFAGIVKEKSGLAGKGLMLGAGVIDSNYRGEVKVLARNFSRGAMKIEKDQKIAQFLFIRVEIPEIKEVEKLSDTERGSGGFGSTGLK